LGEKCLTKLPTKSKLFADLLETFENELNGINFEDLFMSLAQPSILNDKI